MTLYPPSYRQGFAFYRDLVQLTSVEFLWLGLFFLLTWLFTVYLPSHKPGLYTTDISPNRFLTVMLILIAFFITTVVISFYTLQQFANSSDEYAYIFQAEMFSKGKLWDKAHELPDFFYSHNIAQHEGLRLSRFPPGWPMILSVAFVTGFPPFLVNPVLGLVTLIVFYFFARRYYGEQVAIWSLAALALSGFYIFNAASYFSHISCALVTLLFVYYVYLYNEKQNLLYGLLAGFFLSLVVIIRYYTAVIIFIPFVVYLLYHYRLKAIYLFIWIGIGSIPCMAFLFWYNFSITGNALLPVTVWAYSEEQLGFVKGHTFRKGIEHLIRWILMFLYWSSPGLLILYILFLWQKIKSAADRLIRPEDYTFFLLAVGYFFYYEIGGNQYGPRFLFEALPFLIVFIVHKVLQTRERWAVGLLCASLIYAMVKLPFIAYRENRIVIERQDLYKLVDEQKIRNAVVFVVSPTSPIRPMPADDLTRNDASFSNEVIYALELPATNRQLMEYYPDRSFYRYVRNLEEVRGRLIKVR
ncbi:MAG: glycosyltransferase family 39 protein [Cyclobacteriaceae bacterium]